VISSSPAGGAHSWRRLKLDRRGLVGVSCPSTRFCIAVDGDGVAHITHHPNGPLKDWHAIKIDSHHVLGLACASARLCLAIDNSGSDDSPVLDVVGTTNPSRSHRWRLLTDQQEVDPINSGAVSCSTTSDCAVIDDDTAITSTSPIGGRHAWSLSSPDVDLPNGISCAAGGLCVTVDSDGNVSAETG